MRRAAAPPHAGEGGYMALRIDGFRGWAAALSATAALMGCAHGGSEIAALGRSITPLDGAVLAAGAYVVYRLEETPAWEAKVVSEGGAKAVAELSKADGSLGGDGSGSFVFSQAAKKWCRQRGLGPPQTLSFIEYWEPTMLGAKRKAEGEFECEP